MPGEMGSMVEDRVKLDILSPQASGIALPEDSGN